MADCSLHGSFDAACPRCALVAWGVEVSELLKDFESPVEESTIEEPVPDKILEPSTD